MSFAPKLSRPDSKDTARLRAEYEKKAQEFRDSHHAPSKAKLKDEKQKMFQRVVEQMNGERAEALSETHKVLARMGKYKSDEQVKKERAEAEAKRAANVNSEQRA